MCRYVDKDLEEQVLVAAVTAARKLLARAKPGTHEQDLAMGKLATATEELREYQKKKKKKGNGQK